MKWNWLMSVAMAMFVVHLAGCKPAETTKPEPPVAEKPAPPADKPAPPAEKPAPPVEKPAPPVEEYKLTMPADWDKIVEDVPALTKYRCPRPSDFAIVWSLGYGGMDAMPKDDAKFEQLLAKVKEGGFNVIHCTYSDKRLELCRKYGIKMMIDFLAESEKQHVYKTVDDCKALAEKLRCNTSIWGYNIWNESFGKTGAGRERDILNVRRWDPTHPAYIGTYRTAGMRHLVNSDAPGYYDYHWHRGFGHHFANLMSFSNAARTNNTFFYRWIEGTAGQAGNPGNIGRSLFTINTSIACGIKGILYFLALDYVDKETYAWTPSGLDIMKVNKEILPLSKEIMKIGNPTAVYSTPVTKTMDDKPLPEGAANMMPIGGAEFPADFWIQPAGGEFVMGVFKDDRGDAVFVANHNAYAEQNVVLKFTKPVKVSMFDRTAGAYKALEVKDNTVSFRLIPGGGELLRFE